MSTSPLLVEHPPLPNPRYRTLDAWRGLACLMIVVGHAFGALEPEDWQRFGDHPGVRILQDLVGRLYLGVPIFFVISGYCIAATVDSARRKGDGPGRYFVRRFRRIFPPYWIFLGMLLGLSAAARWGGWSNLLTQGDCRIPAPETLTWMQWVGNLTLTEAWRWHIFPEPPNLQFFGPGWTLCYEEQFYAVCGLVLWLWPGRFWQGMVGVTLLTLVPLFLGLLSGQLIRFDGLFFDGRWLVFAAGIAVYYQIHHVSPSKRRCMPAFLAFALIAAVLVRYGWLRHAELPEKTLAGELVIAPLFALTLLAMHPRDQQMASSKLLSPWIFCGQICYSLYMVHWPVTILISHLAVKHGLTGVGPTLLIVAPTATALSILLAWLFHCAVERRFLSSRAS